MRPQPGDLVAWRGHVGIVNDGELHDDPGKNAMKTPLTCPTLSKR
jgi:hypothetical protein